MVHTEVLGQGRLGVRLSRLIATVRTVRRVLMRQIRQVLLSLQGVAGSMGEIVEVLHRIRTPAPPLLADLKAMIRASPAVHADATGWRDGGLKGSLWRVRLPAARSDESHHSRAGAVVTPVRGETFQGVWGSGVPDLSGVSSPLLGSLWTRYPPTQRPRPEPYRGGEVGQSGGVGRAGARSGMVSSPPSTEARRAAPGRPWERPRLSRPCAHAWQMCSPNGVCSWRCQAFLRPTRWPSAVCARWSVLA
jgi:hypothetical protein